MRLGADPAQLEALVALWRRLAITLHRSSVRLASVDRRWWNGRRAQRWWGQSERLSMELGRLSHQIDEAGRRLGMQAEQQRRASLAPPLHQVLSSDHRGDGRWVSRTGAADAEVAVVLIPGVGTDVGDRTRLDAQALQVWRHLAGHVERSDRLGDGAAGHVSVVTWLGFDPPDHLLGGLDNRPAIAGARALRAELDVLRAGGVDHVVLVGHSYGALVATRAAAMGAAPDGVVLLGAPGLGVTDVAAMGMTDGSQLWAAAAPGDLISLAARSGLVHGRDPVPLARELPTSIRGHGSYLSDPVLLAALAQLSTAGLRSPTGSEVEGPARSGRT